MQPPAETTYRPEAPRSLCTLILCLTAGLGQLFGEEAALARWEYRPALLQPFWKGEIVESESVLFICDPDSGEARAPLLFPAKKVISISNAGGDIIYEEGADYRFTTGSREVVVPPASRIVSKTAQQLRRPAGSQKFSLTHRDGGGEILFGAALEYHGMQSSVTYSKAESDWPVPMPEFDAMRLPRTIARLRRRQTLSVALLGDSISTGCNASGWAGGAPFQPPYQELLRQHLQAHYKAEVVLTNLSVGGMATPWGITKIGDLVRHEPDLVLLAFGMNDSAGLAPDEFGKNIATMVAKTRQSLPDAEFILIAPMLGNRDWTRLKHDSFPKFRDVLAKQGQPGIALADMTSVWEELLQRKRDWDLTGNGVNHPNDFGHRIYAQVLSSLLVDPLPGAK